jgi:CheY-like chemotaxis protein
VLDHPITLESDGTGSVFRVEVRAVAAAPPVAVPMEVPRRPAAPLQGLAVLAIDNEPAILDGMRTLLAGWGCRVSVAASLEEALAGLDRRHPPEVVVADYHLDAGNGLEAVVALRETLAADLPAILLTADRSPAVREQATRLGVHVLTKPIKPAGLRALLAQWRAPPVAAE